jgi:4-hydroxy-2-oxoheptanedioate aldolase
MRSADGSFPDKETFEATLTRIREAARRQRVPCGLHVFSAADALRRAREGWQFIAINSELKMMLEGASELTRQVHGEPHHEDLAKY